MRETWASGIQIASGRAAELPAKHLDERAGVLISGVEGDRRHRFTAVETDERLVQPQLPPPLRKGQAGLFLEQTLQCSRTTARNLGPFGQCAVVGGIGAQFPANSSQADIQRVWKR